MRADQPRIQDVGRLAALEKQLFCRPVSAARPVIVYKHRIRTFIPRTLLAFYQSERLRPTEQTGLMRIPSHHCVE